MEDVPAPACPSSAARPKGQDTYCPNAGLRYPHLPIFNFFKLFFADISFPFNCALNKNYPHLRLSHF
jgi:hypothetical protein